MLVVVVMRADRADSLRRFVSRSLRGVSARAVVDAGCGGNRTRRGSFRLHLCGRRIAAASRWSEVGPLHNVFDVAVVISAGQ